MWSRCNVYVKCSVPCSAAAVCGLWRWCVGVCRDISIWDLLLLLWVVVVCEWMLVRVGVGVGGVCLSFYCFAFTWRCALRAPWHVSAQWDADNISGVVFSHVCSCFRRAVCCDWLLHICFLCDAYIMVTLYPVTVVLDIWYSKRYIKRLYISISLGDKLLYSCWLLCNKTHHMAYPVIT